MRLASKSAKHIPRQMLRALAAISSASSVSPLLPGSPAKHGRSALVGLAARWPAQPHQADGRTRTPVSGGQRGERRARQREALARPPTALRVGGVPSGPACSFLPSPREDPRPGAQPRLPPTTASQRSRFALRWGGRGKASEAGHHLRSPVQRRALAGAKLSFARQAPRGSLWGA